MRSSELPRLAGEAHDQADHRRQPMLAAVRQRLAVGLDRAGLVHVLEQLRIARLDADLHLARAGGLHQRDGAFVREVVGAGVTDPLHRQAALAQQPAELQQALRGIVNSESRQVTYSTPSVST